MDKTNVERKIESLLEKENYELVDLKISSHKKKPFFRFFIDRSGEAGITMEECEKWSDKIDAFMGMEGNFEDGYVLEVSSPGVDRVIKKEKDYARFTGRDVKVKLKFPVEGTMVYHSVLRGLKNGAVLLDGGLEFRLEDIEETRLEPKNLI